MAKSMEKAGAYYVGKTLVNGGAWVAPGGLLRQLLSSHQDRRDLEKQKRMQSTETQRQELVEHRTARGALLLIV